MAVILRLLLRTLRADDDIPQGAQCIFMNQIVFLVLKRETDDISHLVLTPVIAVDFLYLRFIHKRDADFSTLFLFQMAIGKAEKFTDLFLLTGRCMIFIIYEIYCNHITAPSRKLQ